MYNRFGEGIQPGSRRLDMPRATQRSIHKENEYSPWASSVG